MRQILMMRPAFMYVDGEGMSVTEWYTDGGKERFQEVEGNPDYQRVRRLRRD
jgi:hypothetical protein